MNEYRVIHNVENGTVESLPVDDAWRLANRPNQVQLTADKTSITADGIDSSLISAQLQNPLGEDLEEQQAITIYVDDDPIEVMLDANGQGELAISAIEAGTITIQALVPDSNLIEIEVIHE